MSYPNLIGYGIVDNPLVDSPFDDGQGGDFPFGNNDFLLMDFELFKLMDGEQLLLLGT